MVGIKYISVFFPVNNKSSKVNLLFCDIYVGRANRVLNTEWMLALISDNEILNV